jgi:hydrogenase expression/formation protein HypC
MCLAVPMKIVEVRPGKIGVAELDGSRQEVNLSLVPDADVGSYVIVHAGFAIERMNEHEANTILAVFEEMAARHSHPSPPDAERERGDRDQG